MLDQLSLILQQDCQLDSAKPVLVGVSGGPDSLCLLDVLDSLDYPVVIAHLNHRLRPEAGDDALAVQRAAVSRGLPFVLAETDVAAYADEHTLSIEEAARTLRYRFLFEQARKHGAQAVAVAHTADDQVETVLMHLLRGSGLAGLRGMPYRALPTAWGGDIPLVRPLLGVWRSEIIAYCEQRGLQPVFDRTNLDTTYYRNRLRHELIPTLESYNPAVRPVVWRMSQTLAGDYAVLEAQVSAAWAGCVAAQSAGAVALKTQSIKTQPLAIQRAIVRRAINLLRPGLRDIGYETIARTLDFVAHPPRTGQRDLAAGLRLLIEGDRMWLAAWEADLPVGDWPQAASQPQKLDIPGETKLPGGWVFSARPAGNMPAALHEARANADPFRAWIDLGETMIPLNVRVRCPGDRFQPIGMPGLSQKLSNFMINVKLPARARNGWPLVCSGEAVLWVPGYRLAHPYRLTAATRQAVFLELQRRES